LASDVLAATKLVQEKKILQQYFSEIAQNSGKYCFGIDETMKVRNENFNFSFLFFSFLFFFHLTFSLFFHFLGTRRRASSKFMYLGKSSSLSMCF